ncbi:class I SAM-dependent methyltransferase [Sulfurovum riftiae]|uniref:Methylase n=1 Tax=Sulfurovum riftiae TaxID=1630136 RepID=A0A151CHL0_9BACT|nr:class I SAM-dependent methyltransferase [Sulfurovum riftiae]KYJ86924.1 methylase [Sulfurovum riftiae]
MLKKVKQFYREEQFRPTILGLFVNPFYFARKGLYQNISELTPSLNGKLLDVGCGTKPYKKLCDVEEYIGLEIDDGGEREHKYADVFYDGEKIPFEDKYFDSVMSNQVFEHVFNPNQFLKEINRVVKLEGFFLLSVPFVWDEHEQPYDYARYSSFGLKYILSENGFEVSEYRKSNNGLEVIFQLLNDYIYKTTLTQSIYINLLIMLIVMAPINLIGMVLSKILPKNNDLYLDNIVLARKVKDV